MDKQLSFTRHLSGKHETDYGANVKVLHSNKCNRNRGFLKAIHLCVKLM